MAQTSYCANNAGRIQVHHELTSKLATIKIFSLQKHSLKLCYYFFTVWLWQYITILRTGE